MKIDPGDRELYRSAVTAVDLLTTRVVVKETDLMILSTTDISDIVRDIVITQRDRLERYIAANPAFRNSLLPLDVAVTAPSIVRTMSDAGRAAGVGPMAAVAGAVCEAIASGLGPGVGELIIENGGDLFLSSRRERVVGVYTGDGGVTGPIGLRVAPERTPIGMCTSSGRIGHSLSFGDAATATVIARSCPLADAAATAVCNRVRGKYGVREGLELAQRIPGVLGAVVIRDGRVGVWGEVDIV